MLRCLIKLLIFQQIATFIGLLYLHQLQMKKANEKVQTLNNIKALANNWSQNRNLDLTKKESEHSLFVKYLTQELDGMALEMVPFVKKLINEAIFEGHLKTLRKTSTIVTESSSETNKPCVTLVFVTLILNLTFLKKYTTQAHTFLSEAM